ncbi:hypothetical protein [Undibacterium sp.]|uniref:hypothetical protein n=1 Tax=Undibacterium sp. TaxID=1914977 RepID=UPI0025E4932E|nr:hypothetical protein [Undibacterium sp.]
MDVRFRRKAVAPETRLAETSIGSKLGTELETELEPELKTDFEATGTDKAEKIIEHPKMWMAGALMGRGRTALRLSWLKTQFNANDSHLQDIYLNKSLFVFHL